MSSGSGRKFLFERRKLHERKRTKVGGERHEGQETGGNGLFGRCCNGYDELFHIVERGLEKQMS